MLVEQLPKLDTIRQCMGLSVFARFMPESQDEFVGKIVKLKMTASLEHNKFILRCIAKTCRKLKASAAEFIDGMIWNSRLGSNESALGLFFLEQLIVNAPEAVVHNAQKFLQMLFDICASDNAPLPRCLGVTEQFLGLVRGRVDLSDEGVLPKAYSLLDNGAVVKFLEVLFEGTPSTFPKQMDYELLKEKCLGVLSSRVDRLEGNRAEIMNMIEQHGDFRMFWNALQRVPEYFKNDAFMESMLCALKGGIGVDVQQDRQIKGMLMLMKRHANEMYEARKEEVKSAVMTNPSSNMDLILFVLDEMEDPGLYDLVKVKLATHPEECLMWMKGKRDVEPAWASEIADKLAELLQAPDTSVNVRIMIFESCGVITESVSWDKVSTMLQCAVIDDNEKVRVAAVNHVVTPFCDQVLSHDHVIFGSLAHDSSEKVRLATVKAACESCDDLLLNPSVTLRNLMAEISELDPKALSLRRTAEHIQVQTLIFAHTVSKYITDCTDIIERIIACLRRRLVVSDMTYFQAKYWKIITVQSLEQVNILIKGHFNDVATVASELWNVLVDLLEQVMSELEIHKTLIAIELMINQQGIVEARMNTKLHNALYEAGAKTAMAETHTVLFRILGKVGVVVPLPRQRPVQCDFFDDAFRYKIYKLKHENRRHGIYARRVLWILLSLLDGNTSMKVKLEAMEIAHKVFRNVKAKHLAKDLPIFLSHFWKMLSQVDRRNQRLIRLLKGFCRVDKSWLPSDFVDRVIEAGSIKPLTSLAITMKKSLTSHLRQLIGFVYSAKDGNPSKVLLFLLKHCQPSLDFTLEILDHLIHRTEMNATNQEMKILLQAFQCAGDKAIPILLQRASRTLRICLQNLELEQSQWLLYVLMAMFPKLRERNEAVVTAAFEARGLETNDLRLALTGNISKFVQQDQPKCWLNENAGAGEYAYLGRQLMNQFEVLLSSTGEPSVNFESFVYFCVDNARDVSLGACSELAHSSYPIARKLFKYAFHSIYIASLKAGIDESFERVISSYVQRFLHMDVAPDIIAVMIDLVEFMDRAGAPLLVLDGRKSQQLSSIGNPAEISNAALGLRCAILLWGSDRSQSSEKLAMSYSKVGMYRQAALLNEVKLSLSDWKKYLPQQAEIQEKIEQASMHPDHADLEPIFELLGSVGGPFFLQGAATVMPYVLMAQAILEVQTLDDRVEFLQRLGGPSSVMNAVNAALLLRIDSRSRQGKSSCVEQEALLHRQAKMMEWNMFESCYNLFYQNASVPISVQIDYTRFLLATQPEDQDRLEELDTMITRCQSESPDRLDELRLEKVLLQLKNQDQLSVEDLKQMRDSINTVKPDVKSQYVCALMNLKIRQKLREEARQEAIPDKNSEWAILARDCGQIAVEKLCYCFLNGDNKRASDLMQMFDIVFGHNFAQHTYLEPEMEQVRKFFDAIPRAELLPIANQLMYYIDSPVEEKRWYMRHLMEDLLESFHDGLVWTYLFSVKCDGVVSNARDAEDGTWKWDVSESPMTELVSSVRTKNPRVDMVFRQAEAMFDGFELLCWTMEDICTDLVSQLVVLLNSCRSTVQQAAQLSFRKFIRDYGVRLRAWKALMRDPKTLNAHDQRWKRHHEEKVKTLDKIINWLPTGTVQFRALDKKAIEDKMKALAGIMTQTGPRIKVPPPTVSTISPGLTHIEHACIPVFGIYSPGKQTQITMQSVCNHFTILPSKMKPRLVRILGSDGHVYRFIIKVGEDLRLDQRAMQVIELVNKLVDSNITTYSITPLSTTLGVIQYLNRTRSIFELVASYRRYILALAPIAGKASVEIENRQYLTLSGKADYRAENFRSIPDSDKLKYFNAVLESTSERTNDLREMMWASASNSSTWLKYLRNFTRSTAVMSIIGAIIGLGDRHPGNILFDVGSGSVIHIDFGDALWAATRRRDFQEKIPFRLTRMMTAAMGPTGYDGPFRSTAQSVVMSLRNHREAIMSILKLFSKAPVFKSRKGTGLKRSQSTRQEAERQGGEFVSLFKDQIDGRGMTAKDQVDRLIQEATSHENLSKLYLGWQPFW